MGVRAESDPQPPDQEETRHAVGNQHRRRGLRGISHTQPKHDNDGRQKADRETGELLCVTELVAMDNTGAEIIKVTTAGEPKGAKRQLVTVTKLVATPWNIDGRGGVAFRADAITPVPTTAPPAPATGSAKTGAATGGAR